MLSKINNLEELLAEKARLLAQIEIVQEELNASANRTRDEVRMLLEDKLSLPKQIGQLFQGGAQQVAGSTAVSALSRAAGMSSWWSGVLSMLAPVLMNFARRKFQERKERKLAEKAEIPPETPAAEPSKHQKRGLFKRKQAKTASDNGDA